MNDSLVIAPSLSKVVLLLGWFQLGGAERQAFLLARELRARGVEVEVWAFEHDALPDSDLVTTLCNQCGIAWRVLPRPMGKPSLPANLQSLWRVFRAMRRYRPAVLVCYTLLPNVIGGLLWRALGVRAFLWGQRTGDYEFVGHRLERMAIKRTRVFTSNSQHAAEFLNEKYGVPMDAVHVIPNGIVLNPPRRNRLQWRLELQADETRLVTVMVAHLYGYKDHAMLVNAWGQVVARARESGIPENKVPLLVLAGRSGDAFEQVEKLIQSLHLEGCVKLLGAIDDVTGLLQASDLCAFCSKVEGVPNGILEAMACGLAVVGSDIPGIREAVGEENAIYLAPSGDYAALSQIIERLLQDEALRRRIGERNRARVEEHFSPLALCENYLALIQKELQGKS